MISGELNPSQLRILQESLGRLDIPPKKRQRLLWRMAKYGLIVAAKRNVRQQKTPTGQAWAPRKSKYKKPLLRNLPKLLKIKELPDQEAVRLYFKGGNYNNGGKDVSAGLVAAVQQNGMTATINRKQTNNKKQDADTPLASKSQARKLRSLNYRIKRGKRWVKAPSSYITANLSRAQAGLIIRVLQNKPVKQSWSVTIPGRAFLGVNDSELIAILERQLQAMNYGNV